MRTDRKYWYFVAIFAAIFIGWLLMRTKVIYEMRAVGFNHVLLSLPASALRTSRFAWLFPGTLRTCRRFDYH